MRDRRLPILALVGVAVLLSPLAAQGSFNSAGACATFGCNFAMLGLLVGGVVGIPVSASIFLGTNLWFCHPRRSQGRQAALGALFGAVAYEVVAAIGALMLTWEQAHGRLPPPAAVLLLGPYVAMLVLSARFARSSPD